MKFQTTVSIISLCLLNTHTRSQNAITQPDSKAFDLGDVARAFSRVNPADFVRPEANPIDEASAEDGCES